MRRRFAAALALCGTIALAGCGEEADGSGDASGEAAAPPRPVLSMVATRTQIVGDGFTGVVAPRFETVLAFRTLGRIISRSADLGALVSEGRQVAAIDSETLEASVRSAEARVLSARAQAENARSSLDRTRRLFRETTASQDELDAAEEVAATAEASLEQALAVLAKARNALGYAILAAPFDGVVTGVSLDVGDVAEPGQPVLTVARTDIREAVVDIPGDWSGDLEPGAAFRIVLQTDPGIVAEGAVREIAPEADARTRTNRVRILLDAPPDAFRLGSLVTATPLAAGETAILAPRSAILETDGEASVWVVDAGQNVVRRRAVTLGAVHGDRVAIASGLEAGERFATAGVHSLADGQPVAPSGE